MKSNLNNIRKLNRQEEILLKELIFRSTFKVPTDWENGLLVSSLCDGEMGSLALLPHGTLEKKRHFSTQVSECQFRDSDGVLVIASLYLDENNELFELDMWKVDFSKLIRIPSIFENVTYGK